MAEETYSSRMFRHLEFLLQELSLKLDQFDLFAVDAGPGSFTGLRVGLTAAKGWAEVYKKPVAGISGLAAIAAQSHSSAPILVPVLDARRGQVYFGIYRRQNDVLALDGEECVMSPEEFFEAVRARVGDAEFTIVSPTPEVFAETLSRLETARARPSVARIEQVSAALAPWIGLLAFRRAQRNELSDALTLDANYVRRTDAEVQWKRLPGS